MTDLEALAQMQKQLVKQALEAYTPIVEDIINSQSTDQNKIEQCLDGMLGFCFDADILLLYKKLCRCFFTLNPEVTAFYINSYREMWDEDSFNDAKKEEI